jgi:dipeptidyl aminopeptidase/acylaminoacyl peptidase
MKKFNALFICFYLLITILTRASFSQTPEKRLLTLDDLFSIRAVGDPQISPDGNWVAYTVRTPNLKEDKSNTDIYMTNWDGTKTIQLNFTKESEHSPRWSPDGKYLAFLSSRDVEGETDQIWLMNTSGGEAQKITDYKGGVNDFVWSPDSKRLALIVKDPDPDSSDSKDKEKKTPKPIIIDRFQFKTDEDGYLTKRRQHLYVFDIAERKLDTLTLGNYDEHLPAWSPDGSSIVFVSKRGPNPDRHDNYDLYVMQAKPGAVQRQLTTFEGADCEPDRDNRPAWSPDGKSLAYIQGGPPNLIFYAVRQVATIPAAGGEAKLLAPDLDRVPSRPRWSQDGTQIFFMLEDDRTNLLAKIPAGGGTIERIIKDRREISSFEISPGGKIVLLSSQPYEPSEVFALDGSVLRPLSRQNEELMSKIKFGSMEEIGFKSEDGMTVNGFVVKPPDYQPGKKYPAILQIHGGPVAQFSNGFKFDWQLFAANGYVVVGCNPRGSSGRGEKYSMAIWADWGNKDAKDILAAVDYIVAQGIADPDRLGIGGWSYGGMLTNYTIAQDKRFKVAVSGASISNQLAGYGTDQYIREYEAELGTPWKNLEVWLRNSFPFYHADRIVTPTLFLCGKEDFNVPLLNSEQMYQALKSLGLDTQLIIYPGQHHGISKPSYQRDRLERYLAWHDKYLMPEKAERTK